MEPDAVFLPEYRESTLKFYETYEPNFLYFDRFETLPPFPVSNLFYGDSITAGFPLADLFPGYNMINRGLPGDTPTGLYLRLKRDLYPFAPKRVFLLAGINGMDRDEKQVLKELIALTELIRPRSEVVLSSVLPVQNHDKYNCWLQQAKICRVNEALQDYAAREKMVFLDYHAALRDENGELAAEYARPDGIHLTAAGYLQMSRVVAPWLL